ncbi:hypothetical protein CIK05_00725 [Bdellovibrio sp. qaytius]|nr:hypothetical protein CIK05_00725 [Bdellovibrio sp. qaytius]
MDKFLPKFKSIFLFALTFSLGFSLFYGYFNENFGERDPAAIGNKIHQLKNFDPEQLREELAQKVRIQNLPDGKKYIRFTSLSSNVCRQYPKVQIQFAADGVSVAGESPIMTIEADCLPAQDPVEMASIEIPVERILKQKPTNASFKFDGITSTFTFSGSGDEWPKTWILRSVIFKNQNGNTKIVAFEKTISSSHQPTVLEF